MPLHIGTYYSKNIYFKDENAVAVNITGWQFRVHIRDSLEDTLLLELTTANGGMTVISGATGHARLAITALQSADFPTGWVVFDVLRTDITPGPTFLFSGKFKVALPVTHDE